MEEMERTAAEASNAHGGDSAGHAVWEVGPDEDLCPPGVEPPRAGLERPTRESLTPRERTNRPLGALLPGFSVAETAAFDPQGIPPSTTIVAALAARKQHYNRIRPHSSLDYRPPAPEANQIGRPRPIPQPPTMAFGLTY